MAQTQTAGKNRHLPAAAQLAILAKAPVPDFGNALKECGLYPLSPRPLGVFQVNLGKMCNQTCQHCHVDAGPTRREIMTQDTMRQCLAAIAQSGAATVDLTGGAPEMNPWFSWFVEALAGMGVKIMVRCNLTIIVSNPKYHGLPAFYRKHKVEVVSSLPYFNAAKTDAQRGNGVFARSIEALKMLNAEGYGQHGTGLALNLVYNPAGAFLPGSQAGLEKQFRQKLSKEHGIVFDSLFCITNLPISRFLEYLLQSGNFEGYMEKLAGAFNPSAAEGVMCRNTLSVGWDGYLYDCDFNQMLELRCAVPAARQHVSGFDAATLQARAVRTGKHCFGCTAGAGSSCGGAVL